MKKIEFILPVGVFILALLAFHLIFAPYFPTATGMLGHDYVGGIPGLLDGYIWFKQNGLFSVPWFSPSFCGGQAYYADPQSGYWSLPQILTILTDPLSAFYLSHLIMASAGFWGMYLLGNRNIKLSLLGSLAAATIFMFNGFFSHRMIAGHTGYQAFMLLPMTAYLLTADRATRAWSRDDMKMALIAGLLIAYWLQSGLTSLMVPAALAVLALVSMVDIKHPGALKISVRRGLVAGVIALALCASKLLASIELMRRFPRTSYPLPGFGDVIDILRVVFASLFYSSQHAFDIAQPLWRNMRWAALPHEMAFGLTVIPLCIMVLSVGKSLLTRFGGSDSDLKKFKLEPIFLLAILFILLQWMSSKPNFNISITAVIFIIFMALLVFLFIIKANKLSWEINSIRGLPFAILSLVILVPFLMLYYSPHWNALLKSIPLISSTSAPLRWLIILVPLIALWTGQLVDQFNFKIPIAAICIVGVPLLNGLEDRDFYLNQSIYDPAEVLSYYRSVRQGEVSPGIERIADARSKERHGVLKMDGLVRGESPLQCYNPLFGYRLENFRADPLREGPVTDEVGTDQLNLRNPACLIYPAENECHPWDGFRRDQREQALRFAHYQPYEFNVSTLQTGANYLSILTLLASLALLSWFLIVAIWRLIKGWRTQSGGA